MDNIDFGFRGLVRLLYLVLFLLGFHYDGGVVFYQVVRDVLEVDQLLLELAQIHVLFLLINNDLVTPRHAPSLIKQLLHTKQSVIKWRQPIRCGRYHKLKLFLLVAQLYQLLQQGNVPLLYRQKERTHFDVAAIWVRNFGDLRVAVVEEVVNEVGWGFDFHG